MSEQRVTMNVAEGFLPHFAPAYLSHYGATSEFVRAVSDLFTLAVAKMLEQAGQLPNPSDVAQFSDDQALQVLRELVRAVETVREPLLQEAHGVAPLGAAAAAVDASLGEGIFRGWLAAFQARDHRRCAEVLTGAA